MILTRIHDGREFPSMSAADRALGVGIGTTAHHIDTYGSTERIGKPWRASGRKITFEGVEYQSIAEAVRVTGKTRDYINWHRGYRKP